MTVYERVERTYEAERDNIYSYLLYMGLPAARAQELAQDSFLKLYLKMSKGDSIVLAFPLQGSPGIRFLSLRGLFGVFVPVNFLLDEGFDDLERNLFEMCVRPQHRNTSFSDVRLARASSYGSYL